MRHLKLLMVLLISTILIAACGQEDKANQEEKTEVKEQDIELTDENQKAAAETVKSYIKAAYSNTDFSSTTNFKGTEYMSGDQEWHQSFMDELAFITNNGQESFEVKDVIIKELIDLGDYYEDETYSPVYIINTKVLFKDNDDKENYESTGILLSYNNADSTWEIDWYNFAQPLEPIDFWGSNNAEVVPANDSQEAAAELAKLFATEFLSLGNRESVDDLRGMIELWIDEEQEVIKQNILSSNESFFQLDKESRPMVANVKIDELLPFREMPIEEATEAYAINVSVEYEENKSLDLTELGFVIVKINDEWKIIQNLTYRITPWEYVDLSAQ
ncbi:hypothetical protein [Ornithinibacillus xuwenensis]|uniref:Uncharacterized protein n=1 Tax=Ornithinibacillus xuwenensis TaxID=3144668 RepID=A0ABU9XJ19_9BACI